jgi:hypothetical protein
VVDFRPQNQPVVGGRRPAGGASAVGSDTPGLHTGDLDGDRLVDAWGRQNDYQPDCASGHVQWQTWRRCGDGIALTSTGCGPKVSGPAAPKAPATFPTGTGDAG